MLENPPLEDSLQLLSIQPHNQGGPKSNHSHDFNQANAPVKSSDLLGTELPLPQGVRAAGQANGRTKTFHQSPVRRHRHRMPTFRHPPGRRRQLRILRVEPVPLVVPQHPKPFQLRHQPSQLLGGLHLPEPLHHPGHEQLQRHELHEDHEGDHEKVPGKGRRAGPGPLGDQLLVGLAGDAPGGVRGEADQSGGPLIAGADASQGGSGAAEILEGKSRGHPDIPE
mmetsp:Transcript_51695/g.117871  ORF Transcript_51695/g.117871 Transcript_51695/m.117871 type:complete len:224 (+) Transcript_51695:452-1123(+)